MTVLIVICIAAIVDLRSLTIPHYFTFIVSGIFIIAAVLNKIPVTSPGLHLLSAGIAFFIAFILFVFGIMGGGDVKLLTALALWVTPESVMLLLASIAICVLFVSIGVILLHLFVNKILLKKTSSYYKLYSEVRRKRVPYGPAIALGTITFIFYCNYVLLVRL